MNNSPINSTINSTTVVELAAASSLKIKVYDLKMARLLHFIKKIPKNYYSIINSIQLNSKIICGRMSIFAYAPTIVEFHWKIIVFSDSKEMFKLNMLY